MSGCCDACVHVEYGIGAYCTRDQRKWVVIDEPEADRDCPYYECRFPKSKQCGNCERWIAQVETTCPYFKEVD